MVMALRLMSHEVFQQDNITLLLLNIFHTIFSVVFNKDLFEDLCINPNIQFEN